MVSKTDIPLIGVALLAIVALAKPIGGLFGQVGSSLGSAFQMGFQNFASSLSGGLIPQSGGGMQQTPTPQGMMQQMMMPTGGGENPAQAVTGGVLTVGGLMAILKGYFDPLLAKLMMPTTTKTTMTTETPSPSIGAKPITSDTLMSFFDMLTAKFPSVTEQLPSIGGYLQQFLQRGGASIEDFAASFKFPSGLTLNDILGASGGKLTPEAAGLIMPQFAYQNLMNPSYIGLLKSEGVDVSKLIGAPLTIPVLSYGGTGSALLKEIPAPMKLMMMGLNIDGKTALDIQNQQQRAADLAMFGRTIGEPAPVESTLAQYGYGQSSYQNPAYAGAYQAAQDALNKMLSMFGFGTNTGQADRLAMANFGQSVVQMFELPLLKSGSINPTTSLIDYLKKLGVNL